jgi:pimeloyl-ACP methyl ester carboxylesterase
MARANLDGVILLGISRGARVCYSAMAEYELPLQGMILLSTPVSSGKAAVRSLRTRLREYFCKLKDPKHLWKLLSGRAHLRRIWGTLATAAGLERRYDPIKDKPFASRCRVLFIYGRLDPNADESSRYYPLKCRQNATPCECYFIDRANHSFFHYKWKEEIFDVSKKWLERVCERQLV